MPLAASNEVFVIPLLSRRRVKFRRIKLFGLTLLTTFWASVKWSEFMPTDISLFMHWFLLILFFLTFGWISLYFFSAVFGFLELVRKRHYEGIKHPAKDAELNAKTAILVPSYNEDAAAVMARVLAMAEDLGKYSEGKQFDFFILSDSTNPEIWLQEEVMWFEAKKQFPQGINLYYRHRPRNTARKSGNIEDFCTRWGSNYKYMLVLDADSLIIGKTMIQMAKLMEANPTTGIIQAPPQIVNAQSFFARLHQFSGKVYGRIVMAGQSYWQAWDSNYWGHNAIIRVQAFIDSCGLPVFKGKAPFGGYILSHDFVEAALIRRAGWLAWMLPELEGSYEECPPSMLDFASRDRRWCQGNLQHIRILISRKIHPVSRVHFTVGIMSYLSSLLWCLLLLFGVGIVVWRYFFPPAYFTQSKELFPSWPIFNVWGTIALFVLSMVMLFFPKILGVLYVIGKGDKQYGGAGKLWQGFFVENLFSALSAPVMMLFQSKFIVEILSGMDSGWKTQNRTAGTSWRDGIRMHWWQTAVGVGASVLIYNYAHTLFYWMLPITLGMMLAIPLSVLSSRVWGKKSKQRIFTIPEEVHEPDILQNSKRNFKQLEQFITDKDMLALLKNDIYVSVHIYLLAINGPMPDFGSDLIKRVQHKVSSLSGGGDENLSLDEKRYLLYDEKLLQGYAVLCK